MWFGKFLIRSFLLSFPVALFWLPVLAAAGFGVVTVFDMLREEIIGLVMLFVLLVAPILTLLSILAIRAGMTILKVTAGSDIARLGFVAARVLKFNVPLMVVIVFVFGMTSTITGLQLLDSGVIDEFQRVRGIKSRFQSYFLIEALKLFPVVLFGGWLVGAAIAFAGMAVNVAGSAAMAVDNPPNHHQIWGVGAQFFNLLLVALIFWIAPFTAAIIWLGGPQTPIIALADLHPYILYGAGVYFLWTFCILSAAAAVAYKIHLADDDTRRTREIEEMAGIAAAGSRPAVDLAALRKARMGGVVAVDPYALDEDDTQEE